MAADRTIWPLLPYDVKILVAFDPRPPLTPRLRDELLACLTERLDATVGASWNVSIELAPPALRGRLLRNIDAILPDQAPVPKTPVDKVLLVAVRCVPDGLEIDARDFDVRTHTLSSSVTRPVSQIGVLSDAMLDAVLAAFAPLAIIDSSKGNEVVLRPKASALPPRDPNLSFIHPGDVFRPIRRLNDKEGNLRKAEPVAWTFLTVDKVLSGETVCQLHSGIRSALLNRRGRRVESPGPAGDTHRSLDRTDAQVADRAVRAAVGATTSIPACRAKRPPAAWGEPIAAASFVVPPGEHIIRVLLIKNGREPLARMPMVPGLEPEMTTEIAKDDLRLWADGFIYSLQEELVDIVARRRIYMALIHARINAGKTDQAEEMLASLKEMPDAMQLSLRVTNERKRLTTNDHVVQRKIDLFLDDTVSLIHQHLDPPRACRVGRRLAQR